MTDKELILNPDKWSKWPMLPLKRQASYSPDCGLIVGDPIGDVVYFVPNVNIWHPDKEKIEKTGRNVRVDELLKEGWVVD